MRHFLSCAGWRSRRNWIIGASAALLLAAAPSAAQTSTEEPPSDPLAVAIVEDLVERFYLLSFTSWGELASPVERDQIIDDLSAASDIERILIISYGWDNDGEGSHGIYRALVRDLLAARAGHGPQPKTAVIGIGWDSSQNGFRKLANNLIPFPVLANWLAFLPDKLLFPISFWSKAAMADRIGYHGLRVELNRIFEAAYPDGRGHPEIVLIGHSFGTRIVSGLMQDELALAKVRSDPFSSAEHVSAAVLIQPALALTNLHRNADYPVVITQTRHDHANGFLFPTANLTVNAYSFTSFEAIARQRVFNVVGDEVEAQTSRAFQMVLPDFGTGGKEPESYGNPNSIRVGNVSIPAPYGSDDPFELLQKGLAEGASVPFSLLYSAVTTPVNYVVTQGRGLARGPHHHLMHTLAQLPVIEIFVDLAGDAVGREEPWGARSKGFFDLGLLNESSGRLFVEPYQKPRDAQVVTYDAIVDGSAQARLGCELDECRGLIFVDASSIIDEGVFGLSLENRMVDYTLGWLDPVGSHANYRNEEVVDLMMRVINPRAELATQDH